MNLINVSDRTAEILLIEDNLGDVLLTKEAFRNIQFKHNLYIAKDGEQALQMLKREGKFTNFPKPDMILLDLNLPKIDGREVLEKIKSDITLRDIPVIVLSGSDAESDITTCYDRHANSYVIKPDNFDDLKQVATSIQNYWFEQQDCNLSKNSVH